MPAKRSSGAAAAGKSTSDKSSGKSGGEKSTSAAGKAAAPKPAKTNPHVQWKATFGRRGAKAGQFNDPSHLAVGSGDELYVVDSDNNRVQVFSIADVTAGVAPKFVKSFGTSGPGTADKLNEPTACALTDSECFVSDTGNNRIAVYRRSDGSFVRSFALDSTAPAPAAVTTLKAGGGNGMDTGATAQTAQTIASAAAANNKMSDTKQPTSASMSASVGDAERAAEATKQALLAALAAMDMNDADDAGDDDMSDAMDGMGGGDNKSGGDDGPSGIAVAASGELYVAYDAGATSASSTIRVLNASTGQLIRVFGAGASTATSGGSAAASAASAAAVVFGDTISSLAVAGDLLYVVDTSANRIVVLNRHSGEPVSSFGAKGSGDGQLDEPTHIAVGGNRLFVADAQNSRIQVFDHSPPHKFLWKVSGESADVSFEIPSSVVVHGSAMIISDALRSKLSILQLAVPVTAAATTKSTTNSAAAAAAESVSKK